MSSDWRERGCAANLRTGGEKGESGGGRRVRASDGFAASELTDLSFCKAENLSARTTVTAYCEVLSALASAPRVWGVALWFRHGRSHRGYRTPGERKIHRKSSSGCRAERVRLRDQVSNRLNTLWNAGIRSLKAR